MLGIKAAKGFNLLELMVGVAIVGVLSAIAVPSFNSFIETQRSRSSANDLVSSLNFARSEAVKRNASVTVAQSSGSWNNGWTIAVGATVLRNVDPVSGVAITAGAASFLYAGNGRPSASMAFTVIPSSGDSSLAHCVQVSLSGKPRNKGGACS